MSTNASFEFREVNIYSFMFTESGHEYYATV